MKNKQYKQYKEDWRKFRVEGVHEVLPSIDDLVYGEEAANELKAEWEKAHYEVVITQEVDNKPKSRN